MKTKNLLILISLLSINLFAQEIPKVNWVNVLSLGIEGKAWKTTKHSFNRLPDKAKGVVRKPLWDFSENSAGFCIHFISNTKSIKVDYIIRSEVSMPHVTDVLVKGVDLYALDGELWRWAGASKPHGKRVTQTLISGMDGNWREYKLYLPCYDGVDEMSIGIDRNAKIEAFDKENYIHKPIVFYGTSIMQGCSASRPGYVTSNIVGRKIHAETVNLGFSGNGELELEMAKLMSEIDASCYIVDCLPNLNPDEVKNRVIPFCNLLRKLKQNVPIVLVGEAGDQRKWLSREKREFTIKKNCYLIEAFILMKNRGVKNLFFVSGDGLIGTDFNNTIDGIHYTDIGYLNYVKSILPTIKRALE